MSPTLSLSNTVASGPDADQRERQADDGEHAADRRRRRCAIHRLPPSAVRHSRPPRHHRTSAHRAAHRSAGSRSTPTTADTVPAVPSAPPDDHTGGLVQRTMASLNERFRRYEDMPLVDFGLRHLPARPPRSPARSSAAPSPSDCSCSSSRCCCSSSVSPDSSQASSTPTMSTRTPGSPAASPHRSTRRCRNRRRRAGWPCSSGCSASSRAGYSLSKVMVASSAARLAAARCGRRPHRRSSERSSG